jgi:hypothetical protein
MIHQGVLLILSLPSSHDPSVKEYSVVFSPLNRDSSKKAMPNLAIHGEKELKAFLQKIHARQEYVGGALGALKEKGIARIERAELSDEELGNLGFR